MIGGKTYLSHSRHDIAYAAGVVSQFMHLPGKLHSNAIYKILRYLKSKLCKGLLCILSMIIWMLEFLLMLIGQVQDRHKIYLTAF